MHLTAIVLAAALAALAAATPTKTAPALDWKFAVGWDGTTLPASDIGSALTAAPTARAARDGALEKRTVGGVFICTDVNWGGHCGYAVQPLNTCIVLGSEWKDKISSFGPDKCTHCTAYSQPDCTTVQTHSMVATAPPASWQFDNPGDATGGIILASQAVTPGGPWNDRIESFKCVRSC